MNITLESNGWKFSSTVGFKEVLLFFFSSHSRTDSAVTFGTGLLPLLPNSKCADPQPKAPEGLIHSLLYNFLGQTNKHLSWRNACCISGVEIQQQGNPLSPTLHRMSMKLLK